MCLQDILICKKLSSLHQRPDQSISDHKEFKTLSPKLRTGPLIDIYKREQKTSTVTITINKHLTSVIISKKAVFPELRSEETNKFLVKSNHKVW